VSIEPDADLEELQRIGPIGRLTTNTLLRTSSYRTR
jgi:hypothetical protein